MVTAVELARRLQVDPKTLRAWLRTQARAGHPLLAGHVHYGRWEFGEDDADELAAAYSGSGRRSLPARPPKRRSGGPSAAADAPPGTGHCVSIDWRGETVETLADLLRDSLRAVCVGINPSPVSVEVGHYYQGRLGQRFWQRLRKAGVEELADRDGFEDDAAFAAGVGFTDVVKRPTRSADELDPEDFEHGRAELTRKLQRFGPGLVIFTFETVALELFGPFEGYGFAPKLRLAGIDAFVMPGPYEPADRAARALSSLRPRL